MRKFKPANFGLAWTTDDGMPEISVHVAQTRLSETGTWQWSYDGKTWLESNTGRRSLAQEMATRQVARVVGAALAGSLL